jgi:hypothetical protein
MNMNFTENTQFKKGDRIVTRMELLGYDLRTVEVPVGTLGEVISVDTCRTGGAEVVTVKFDGIEKSRYFTQGAPALAYP